MRPPEEIKGIDLQTVDWNVEYDVIRTLQGEGHELNVIEVEEDLIEIHKIVDTWKPHVAFNLLEAFRGISLFDQNVVSYLELLDVPYTGCNPRGLMVARHKALAKKILAYHGVLTPPFELFRKNLQVSRPKDFPFPIFVKSVREEASLGISEKSIVTSDKELEERVHYIHEKIGTNAIAEAYIEGRELYVGVLGNQRLETLPVWELYFQKDYKLPKIATETVKFNPKFRKKHGIDSGEAKNLPEGIGSSAQEISKQAYRLLGLNGYARIDFRVSEDGKLYLLEANPNPHLAKSEDFARAAEKTGLSYADLLWKIILLGVRWKPEEFSMAM